MATGGSKKGVHAKEPEKSAPKSATPISQQRQGVRVMHRALRKSNSDQDSNQIADNVAVILKESFASLLERLSQGFNALGQMFQDNLDAGLMSTESKYLNILIFRIEGVG